jgi:hypothetical protein
VLGVLSAVVGLLAGLVGAFLFREESPAGTIGVAPTT